MLRLLTRTRIRIRQGHKHTWTRAPVDFSALSTEYVGILYEGLLDYELKTAPPADPVIFISVGMQPALPLSRLEAMDDRALKALFKELKDPGAAGDDAADDPESAGETVEVEFGDDEVAAPGVGGAEEEDDEMELFALQGHRSDQPPEMLPGVQEAEIGYAPDSADERGTLRTRAETWARRAAIAAGLVNPPRGRKTAGHDLVLESRLAAKAHQLVARVVLPGEWYLARWGGTRKGSGSFYTRPGLAVPTVQRTLRPLAWDPPGQADAARDFDAPPSAWIPKKPEEILQIKVCDPACGSGSFPLAALRFLTDTLYTSLQYHDRIDNHGERTLVHLLGLRTGAEDEADGEAENPGDETIPCRPDDDHFEPRLKAVLRRYVVERCIYAVDLDPLAVELCRLSLWIETMDRTLPFGFVDHKIKCGNSLVGAWFDQFRHYPVMAWKNREGGDKTHSRGGHFKKNARTQAIKAFVKDTLKPDLQLFLSGGDLFSEDLLRRATTAHDDALAVLEGMHALPVQDTAERARIYREDLAGSAPWRSLKAAMDLWCACWFWPADEIEHAPLPSNLEGPPRETWDVAARVAAGMRFFHWELEFPDVFREAESGFDAMLGNPPWDVAKPVSMEFFSSIDPLYRSYGKQDALDKQAEYFNDRAIEQDWLDYNARFRAQSNFVSHAASPFGDPEKNEKSQHRFFIVQGKKDAVRPHDLWREARAKSRGYADTAHPFRRQGSADLNLYKLFLETAHALLRDGGRLGFIAPSGIYSDHGTGALRRLFLERCRWEWLFGIENRDKIFPIHRSYKFNPLIIQKGGTTEAIRTAFMRRRLEDWEHAEDLAIPYTLEQVEQFSPKSLAILEIQSKRDLDLLEKVYANAVLLGDGGLEGWGIRYAREFDMTNDSRLFPPRPKWEARGYRPDEYSRWLLGEWRPIGELWAELDVDPSQPRPAEIELEDWLFDTTASPERREAEVQLAHGHLLKPGDVARTDWRLRCAQPPYDDLPIPRAEIPAGIVLSREGDVWIREEEVEGVALPLYEGRMVGQLDFSQKGWVSGKGRSAVWRDIPWENKQIEPQYLMARTDYLLSKKHSRAKVAIMSIGSSTNTRTTISSYLGELPAGNSVAVFKPQENSIETVASIAAIFSSFTFDMLIRNRISGLNMNEFIMAETALPKILHFLMKSITVQFSLDLNIVGPRHSAERLILSKRSIEKNICSIMHSCRLERTVVLDALAGLWYGLDLCDFKHILKECDAPQGAIRGLDAKGFWRVDRDKDPELRHTVLTQIAFHDLEAKITAADGDRQQGIEAFLAQNHGEGWMLPETLRLADYGLGHDERAHEPQPVASRLGPRFCDWQLAQSADESWRECHLHARNLLGEHGYDALLRELNGDTPANAEHELFLKATESDTTRDPGARDNTNDNPQISFWSNKPDSG